MLTKTDCQQNIDSVFTNPGLGKEHLLRALNSGNQQTFLFALHDVMDAILQELESEQNYCRLN